jgi:hypothetical protein
MEEFNCHRAALLVAASGIGDSRRWRSHFFDFDDAR